MIVRRVSSLLALGLLAVAGATAQERDRGERLFNAHCSICHGIGGTGGRGPDLRIQPFTRVRTDSDLLKAVREGLRGTEMPGVWSINEEEAESIVRYVRSLAIASSAPVPGDPARGRDLYDAADCSTCHIVAGSGRGLGPELTTIGSSRAADHLRRAIARPGADVSRGYVFVQAQTASGDRVEGIRLNEDAFTVQLRDFEGRLHSFRKDQLKSVRELNGRSLMPDYAARFSATELDDLVAYLTTLKRAAE